MHNFQRHIIWRSKYLNKGIEKVNKEEREILERYEDSNEKIHRVETYEEQIYITDIKNMVDYDTENYESSQNVEYVSGKNDKKRKNQILMSAEDDEDEPF